MPKRVQFPRVKPDVQDFSDEQVRSSFQQEVDGYVQMSEAMAAAALERADAVRTVSSWLVDPSTAAVVDADVLAAIRRVLRS